MKLASNTMEDYLRSSRYINWKEPEIVKTAAALAEGCGGEVEAVGALYHFVRDEVAHSWDAQDRRVTARASQVLRERVGICWAKANLLAALLRARGMPAGICYQRLTLGDTPDTGYCIHALNAVYLRSLDRWIRLDARGNKPGVQAELSLDQEQLAFTVRPEMGEEDYGEIRPEPAPITMKVLESSNDALHMYLHDLPACL